MKRTVVGLFFIMALLLLATGLMLVSLAVANPLPAPPILEIYIRSDGSVDPSTVPIQRVGNIYTFKSNLTNSTIEVQRDNVVIDGAGFTLQGNGAYWNTGIALTNRSNVIIKNIDIRNYVWSISLTASSNILIYHNNMLTAWNILLDSSANNQIIGNTVTGQDSGYGYCITIDNDASNNLMVANNFSDAGRAVTIFGKNNTFYKNNFVGNSNNVVGWVEDEEANSWDNGTSGNFWSDYRGIDADGDGVGDTPYAIGFNESPDRYPLMAPFDIDSLSIELPEWASAPASAGPSTSEPFPTALVATASVAIFALVGGGLLVYFKKRHY